jgi:signal transduction histidine kinase/ActR/RegA family two-component response regulator
MPGAGADSQLPIADASRAALEFAQRLLSRPASEPAALEALLHGLAEAVGAAGAGMAALPSGAMLARSASTPPPGTWPWQDDLDLPGRLRQAAAAQVVPTAHGNVLATIIGPAGADGWLVWVEAGNRTAWSPGEAAALAVVGDALGRRLREGVEQPPRWVLQLDRARRQQRLEQAAAVSRRLAHDFGNVLTGILGFSELALAQQGGPPATLQDYLSEIHKGAQDGARLMQVLRLFSRRQALPTRSCALAAVLAEEEARLRRSAGPTVHFRTCLDGDLPTMALDAEQLAAALGPVLDNAREAATGPGLPAEAPPEITVRARAVTLDADDCRELYGDVRPGKYVEIVVADNGPGLSPEARRLLFAEPFFSGRSRRRGFGLATTYGILFAHRGGLDVRSGPTGGEAKRGVGVEVRLVVPAALQPAPTEAPPVPRRGGERILVVEDDPMLLQFVMRILGAAGYSTQAAPNGEEGLRLHQRAGNDPFALVLTDILMPGLNGVELVDRLLAADAQLRVVFMSGQVSLDYLQQTFQGASCEVLAKPFHPEGLLRVVRQALDRPPVRSARTTGPAEGAAAPAPPGNCLGRAGEGPVSPSLR